MVFLHPMWLHESQRIGKRKCTPIGYALHVSADIIGFAGLFLLVGVPFHLVYRWLVGTYSPSNLWLLLAPFGLGTVSEVLYHYSWWLARRKDFHFDYEHSEASWMEAGQRKVFKWQRQADVEERP
jgi:hypothetical protein